MKNSYLEHIAMIRIFHEDVYSLVLRLDLKQSKFIYILKINIMKKFFSIIALSAMTLSLSSFDVSKSFATVEVLNTSATECNRIARNATNDFAVLAFNETASGDSQNNELYVEFHNSVYRDCLGE